VPARKGMAGVDAITKLMGGGTSLGAAIQYVNAIPHDRLIVITDEQSQDRVGEAKAKHAYMINVAGYRPEVGYGSWTRISGFSENVLRYISEAERMGVND
jgi:60 kDa SS-A/Ro ribonucleoprotein